MNVWDIVYNIGAIVSAILIFLHCLPSLVEPKNRVMVLVLIPITAFLALTWFIWVGMHLLRIAYHVIKRWRLTTTLCA